MEDKTKNFVVFTKDEIKKLENRIHELTQENQKLQHLKQKLHDLEFENSKLKNKLIQNGLNNTGANDVVGMNLVSHPVKGSDNNMICEFICTQEAPDVIPRSQSTPNHSPVANGHQTDGYSGAINVDSDSTNDSVISYVNIRRKSNFYQTNGRTEKESDNNIANNNGNERQQRIIDTQWSYPDFIHTKTVSELATNMRYKRDHQLMLKTVVDHWNRRPENMTRMEFFYHLLSIFIETGVLVTHCTEHSPPCPPKVDPKIFEANAQVLKSFVKCINGYKMIVIEVELLVALENIAYCQPKYRLAIGDIMDILFRKGVVEAVAFGEWSQTDTHRKCDKRQLIVEIKASGFSLLKRSSSYSP